MIHLSLEERYNLTWGPTEANVQGRLLLRSQSISFSLSAEEVGLSTSSLYRIHICLQFYSQVRRQLNIYLQFCALSLTIPQGTPVRNIPSLSGGNNQSTYIFFALQTY